MPSRALPRLVDRHMRDTLRDVRAIGRTVTLYIATTYIDNSAYDSVSGGPINNQAFQNSRTYQYTTLVIPVRVRWNSVGANIQDNGLLSGFIKEGDATIYVSVADTPWIQKTQGNDQSYLSLDGLKMKVISGPNPEGFGQIIEYSFELNMYAPSLEYSTQDGGVPGAFDASPPLG